MKTLIAQIQAAGFIARDWHYQASGPSFYAQHLLADKVADGLESSLDEIREVYYLGEKRSIPPSAGEEMEAALAIYSVAKGESLTLKLQNAVELVAAHAEELSRDAQISIGTKSLLDALSARCYQSAGLIERTIK